MTTARSGSLSISIFSMVFPTTVRMLFAAGFLSAATFASADVIELKNGQTLRGTVVRETEERVYFRSSAGEIPLLRSQISSIEIEGEAVNALREIEKHRNRGDALGTLEILTEAYLSGIDSEALALEFAQSRPMLIREIANPVKYDKPRLRLAIAGTATSSWMEQSDVLLCVGWLLDLQGVEQAAKTFELVRVADFAAMSDENRQEACDLTYRIIQASARTGNNARAIRLIERSQLLACDQAASHRLILSLTNQAKARELGDYEEALRIVSRDLVTELPEISRNRIQAIIRALKTHDV